VSGSVKWDAQDEAWLRDALGMHDIDVKVRQAEMDQRKATWPLSHGQPATGAPSRDRPKRNTPATAPLRALSISTSQAPTEAPYRTLEYSEWESRVLRPEIIVRDLDLEQLRLTAEVQSVLREIDNELRDEAESLAGQGPQAIADNVRNVAVSGASSGSSAPR
jgi:hypothetical protein